MKDDMLSIGFLLAALATIFNTAECDCYTKSLKADTTTKSYAVDIPGNDCFSVYIRPSSSYRSAYFLEISWSGSKFDVKGDMPLCKNEYVEVRLTSKYKTIGKFCSNNAGKPFSMYSNDGYAQIFYSTYGHSTYETGRGFTFYYRMRSNKVNNLGTSVSSSACYNTKNYRDSGVISSTGWPVNYKPSSSPCVYTIERLCGYQGISVIFMDIEIRCYYVTYTSYHSCVQLLGSNSSSYDDRKAISYKFCGQYKPKAYAYTTYNKYLQIIFKRGRTDKGFRGFLAGYIMFRAPSTTGTPNSSSTAQQLSKTSSNSRKFNVATAVLSVLLIAIIIINIAALAIIYNRKRNKLGAGEVNNEQPQSIVIGSTSQEDSVQQTVQSTHAMLQKSSVSQSFDESAPTNLPSCESAENVSALAYNTVISS